MTQPFGPRRGEWIEIDDGDAAGGSAGLADRELRALEAFDRIYRGLCAMLYNYAPTSGHPGGSISSGRIVEALVFGTMDYDIGDPDRAEADLLSYAAGHKALGLYALWALRDEVVRLHEPSALPADPAYRLRLEDLLGFRRNPTTETPLFRRFGAKPLDGHPTPATPFVRLATGASGVGMATSLGLALGAADAYGPDGPRVHILEGEGGLTPGRVSEALAFAGSASLSNAVAHVDWNQASIDSNRVCRDGEEPGDYVQWDPRELFYLHDWNVIHVADGTDFRRIAAAQHRALELAENGRPTAVVYRTTKGWRYGIEGKASHGGGHSLCSPGFYDSLTPLVQGRDGVVPTCDPESPLCGHGADPAQVEECFWRALQFIRRTLAENPGMVGLLAERVLAGRERLAARDRALRPGAAAVEDVFVAAGDTARPDELALEPGSRTTLRAELGRVLGHYNRAGGGALLVGAADLLDSTAISKAAEDFDAGYFDLHSNPGSRTIAAGGIAEDAMSGILSGLSSYGRHVGVGSSYGAFIAPLGHISARLHAIGGQARRQLVDEPYRTFILVCGHAGLKTGEDGPTHADPQALQLLQENFPPGTMVTLTPWDPQELWWLITGGLRARPAVLAPFVTRPSEMVIDRPDRGLAPPSEAATGVYRLREAGDDLDATVVLQGSEVAYAFVQGALPLLDEEGLDVEAFYVSSAELFDALPAEERREIFPPEKAGSAMGITGFTLPTMYRWVTSELGRERTLHPYRHGHYPGSGAGETVVSEAGLDGRSQFEAIRGFAEARGRRGDVPAPAAGAPAGD